MMHAKQVLLASAGVGLLVVAAVACSANADATFGDDGTVADSGARPEGDKGATAPSTTSVAASGIVLVHAASFPSFRLCFENFLDQKPQPDSDIMPESNLVGVETGTFVRFPAMDPPGRTYVIPEQRIRGLNSTCRELLKGSAAPLGQYFDYDTLLEPLDTALGQHAVDVVAISGCGSSYALDRVGISKDTCPTGYTSTGGNLRAHRVSLQASPAGGLVDASLPVQLYQLSTDIDTLAGTGKNVAVRFGDLSSKGVLGQAVPVPALFETGMATNVTFDRRDEAVYGTYGFRITVGPAGSQSTIDQSLATVQDLSSSNEVPSTYYGAASNYALLLLGDPKLAADAGVAGARSRMHILAVPVIDPSTVDAGTDAATSPAVDGG